jgi:hypothetical protein
MRLCALDKKMAKMSVLLFFKEVFHPVGVALFPSSHYNYKLQFLDFLKVGGSLLPRLSE